MKKTPIKILTIVAVMLISIGVLLCGIGWAKNESIAQDNFTWKGLRFDVADYFDDIDDTTTSTHRNDRFAVEDFHNLDMDFDIGDFEIIQDSETYIEVKNLPSDKFTYKVENNTLYVSVDASSWEHNFRFNDEDYSVKLHVNKDLGNIKVISNMGDIDMHKIICESLRIEQSMGDIDIENVNVKGAVYMEQDMGEISFSGRIKADSEFKNAMGDTDVKIYDHEENYTYDLETSMGDIQVNERMVANSIDNTYAYKGNSSKATILIHNAMGDIELEFDR